jgi:hypothetical protein
MSDIELVKFGKDKANADAGFQSANVDRDTGAVTVKKPEPVPSTEDSIRSIASELAESRRGRPIAEDTHIAFVDKDPDAPKVAFTLEQAADVVKNAREVPNEANKQIDAFKDQETRDYIDNLRGDPTRAEREQAQATQAAKAAQHEDNLRAALEHMERKNAEERAAQIDNREAQVQRARMAQMADIGQLAPELHHMNDLGQLPQIIAAIEQRDPNRARAIKSKIATLSQLNRAAHATAQAKQQHANTEFQRYAKAEDAKFMAKHGRDADFRTVGAGVADILKSHGISPEEYARIASTPEGRFLRSSEAQSLLYSMSKAMSKPKTMADLQGKKVPPVVPTHIGFGSRAPTGAPAGAALNSRINKVLANTRGDSQVKALAKILAETRRGGR